MIVLKLVTVIHKTFIRNMEMVLDSEEFKHYYSSTLVTRHLRNFNSLFRYVDSLQSIIIRMQILRKEETMKRFTQIVFFGYALCALMLPSVIPPFPTD